MSTLSRTRAVKPDAPQILELYVIGARQVSSGFQRITVGGEALGDLPRMGFDQWFRLFVPTPEQGQLKLMQMIDGQWYRHWLDMPDADRPVCRNYTIRDYRPDQQEIDIDFVLHRGPSGAVEGAAAQWSLAAAVGDPIALLDQGILFNPGAEHGDILVVCDETGVPAAEGIARDLPRDQIGHFVLEVASADDIRTLETPDRVTVRWVLRDTESGYGDASAVPGRLAGIAGLETNAGATTYVYAVGEASFVTGLRSRLAERGVDKDNIDFCAYWRADRER